MVFFPLLSIYKFLLFLLHSQCDLFHFFVEPDRTGLDGVDGAYCGSGNCIAWVAHGQTTVTVILFLHLFLCLAILSTYLRSCCIFPVALFISAFFSFNMAQN